MAGFTVQSNSGDTELLVKVVLDLTVYAERCKVSEFDVALNVYRQVCPKNAWKFYKIAETPVWDSVERPFQTVPRGGGGSLAFLDRVKDRIEVGRRAELCIWDGERGESWSFRFRYLPGEEGVTQCFYRINVPAQADSKVLADLAIQFVNRIQFLSGHGGYSFFYNGWKKSTAFSDIYKLARRYWAIDIEDLNLTLTLMQNAMKCVSWATLVGSRFLAKEHVGENLNKLDGNADIEQVAGRYGRLLIAADRPVVGDRNRSSGWMIPYCELAAALEPVLVSDHPQFSGRFNEEECTMAWFRRFNCPEAW